MTSAIPLPEWAEDDRAVRASPIYTLTCCWGNGMHDWGHCTVCGVGIMYGSRCSDHPWMAGWSDEYRQKWLAEHTSSADSEAGRG